MTHTAEAARRTAMIPRPRLWAKVRDTLLGILFLGGAVWMATHGVDWKAYLAVAVFGGVLISRDLMKHAASFVVALLRDVLNVVRGNGSPPA
jgi:hypothetical protein